MTDVTAEEFKLGMRQLAAAVNIISVFDNGRPKGMLATAVCSVCAEPPTLLVCINQSASTHDAIGTGGAFCVSLLSDRQLREAGDFMSPEPDTRFDACDWDRLKTGASAVRGALVNFDCEVVSSIEMGTHTIYFGKVLEMRRSAEGGCPLMFYDGQYASLGRTVEQA